MGFLAERSDCLIMQAIKERWCRLGP